MKKLVLITSVLFLISVSVFAADKKYNFENPSAKEVMIVGKVKVNCPVNEEFLSNALGLEKAELINACKIGEKKVNVVPSGEFFTMNIEKENDKVLIDELIYYIFDDVRSRIFLPILKEGTIEKDEKYIYIGTYTYDIDPYTFTIKSVKVTDEFDGAKEFLKTVSKSDKLELVRVPLKDIKL